MLRSAKVLFLTVFIAIGLLPVSIFGAPLQEGKKLSVSPKEDKKDKKDDKNQTSSKGGKILTVGEKTPPSSSSEGKGLAAASKLKEVPKTSLAKNSSNISPNYIDTPPPRPHIPKPRPIQTDEPEIAKEPENRDPGTSFPVMVSVPGGSFQMGSALDAQAPLHMVKVSSFEMSTHEITNNQFSIFVENTGYKTTAEQENLEGEETEGYQPKPIWKDYMVEGREGYPVVLISWQDAMEYCNWLSSMKMETYRLPTEAEWEYAAQGGMKGQPFPWGDKIDVSKANYAPDDSRVKQTDTPSKFIRHVGSYKPNGYQLYDMAGNVWEWCYDWYAENYYANSPTENPMGPAEPTKTGGLKVRRGGSWATSSEFCRINQRYSVPIDFKSPSLGFRIVKELPKVKN